ncbi:arginine--tRNA ligase, partial [Candidatus Woesearchaeota archaeon]|nr:arginine--tRNA ligase [Candidatus Woesearchaeota archaeon]
MFEDEIRRLVKQATGLEEVSLEVPPDPKMGDFAFPCYMLSKTLKKNPTEIAKELAAKIPLGGVVGEVKHLGPYLNFFLNKEKLSEAVLERVLMEKNSYGSSNIGKGKKALIEHSSINPNAEPHIGRVRNSLIGDSLVRVLKFQGYKVESHFFVNDVGKQIAMLVLASHGKNPDFKELLRLYVDFNKK